MKGIVFTEFLDHVGALHGADMVDDIIDDCDLPNGGAYTSVGTYDFAEMHALVVALSRRAATDPPELLVGFGRVLCRRFVEIFPGFFSAKPSLFPFLDSVDGQIHVEVRKLYPDAELPSFRTNALDTHAMELDYRSKRPLESLAEGLILGAAEYYRETVVVTANRHVDGAGPFFRFRIEHTQ